MLQASLGPPVAFLSSVILMVSGNKEAVVGRFMGIVTVSLWVVLV